MSETTDSNSQPTEDEKGDLILPIVHVSIARGGGIGDLTLTGGIHVSAKELAKYTFDYQQEVKRLYDGINPLKTETTDADKARAALRYLNQLLSEHPDDSTLTKFRGAILKYVPPANV